MSFNTTAEHEKDITHDVHTAKLDDATTAQLSEALIAALNDPAMKKKAYEGVAALAAKMRQSRAAFVKIASDFVAFDSAQVKDNHGKVIQLGSQWTPYIKMFDDTLQYSLEQVTEAVVLMTSINAVLGDVETMDRKDLITELQNFMTILGKKEAVSLAVKNKWSELSDKVQLFALVVSAASGSAHGSFGGQLQQVVHQLVDLANGLKQFDEKAKSLVNSTISTVSVAISGARVANISLVPASDNLNIWQTINLDMHALNNDLTHEASPDAPISKHFIKRLRLLKDLYKHFKLLLERYVEQVRA